MAPDGTGRRQGKQAFGGRPPSRSHGTVRIATDMRSDASPAAKGTERDMLISAMLLSSAIGTYEPQKEPIQCHFPSVDAASQAIRVTLDPRPSLKDQPELWRVIMQMNGKLSVRASAQPIDGTRERDILIRGVTKRKSTYIIGLRDDGTAALNMATRMDGNGDPRKETRQGVCHGFEAHINRWLPS